MRFKAETESHHHAGVLRRFGDRLPIGPDTPLISLGEGDTPLVRSRRLHERVGCRELYFKLELCNPTGSFKDRGMVVAVAKALESESKAVLCASTGNTSASAAAYAAHCGLDAYVLVPHGNIAQGKLAQAVAHGARVLDVRGNFDDALRLARVISEKHRVALVNSVNPHRLEGQKTAAFEIVDALGDAPDLLFIPVGNAGNISAYWRGFVEYYQAERASEEAEHGRLAGGRRRAHRHREGRGGPAERRLGDPHRQPGQLAAGRSRARRVRRRDQRRLRRRDPRGVPAARAGRGDLLRARLCRLRRRPASSTPQRRGGRPCAPTRGHRRLHHHWARLKDPETALAIESEMREVEPRIEAIEEAMGL